MGKDDPRVAADVSPEVKERIEQQLDYGDHISDWLREAISEKLARQEGEEGNAKPTPATAN